MGRARDADGARPAEGRLTPAVFAERFAEEARALWVVAAACLGRREFAEDVVQEAAMIALQKLDEFEPGTNLRAWLAQIVRFVAQNRRRAEGRGAFAVLEGDAVAAPPAAATPISADGALREGQECFDDRMLAALDELSDVARACLLLRAVEDLSFAEIGATLGIPENTATSHVHRARERLRARLETQTQGGNR